MSDQLHELITECHSRLLKEIKANPDTENRSVASILKEAREWIKDNKIELDVDEKHERPSSAQSALEKLKKEIDDQQTGLGLAS